MLNFPHKLNQFFLFLCLLLPISVSGENILDEGLREFEQLRLRQLQTVQTNGSLAEFSTDGCSGNLSSSWNRLAEILPRFADEFGHKPPWENCCISHDKHYWRGATVNGYEVRLAADEALRRCVVETGERITPTLVKKHSITKEQVRQAFVVIGDLMFHAVRLGGQSCSLLPWRWGYGWANCAFSSVTDIPANYSDIKAEEHVVFFNTSAWLDKDGKHWIVPIHGWIYEPEDSRFRLGSLAKLIKYKYGLEETTATRDNFRRRANLLLADNEHDKQLIIRIAGQDRKLPLSVENGHILTLLKLPVTVVNAFANNERLHFFAVTLNSDKRRFEGDVGLLDNNGLSIISDIDDTVKISEVTDRRQLLNNTFFEPFREVSGMAEVYYRLVSAGASLHFVSSSPWQLHDPLLELFEDSGFPWGTMSLKTVRFRDKSLLNLFKPGTETKPAQIKPILKRYSGRQFILIGDSGEQDPEVYAKITRAYPSQINKILIRNVDNSFAKDERYQNVFRDIPSDKWQLFNNPNEIDVNILLGNSQQ